MPIRHEDQLPAAVATRSGLAHQYVKKRIRALKDAGLVSAGRPAPPLTTADLARIVISLGAARHTDVPGFVRNVSVLGLYNGDGADTAEAELVDIIDAAIFSRPPRWDLWSGELVIGQTRPSLTVTGLRADLSQASVQYRGHADQAAQVRAEVRIPFTAIRDLARDVFLES